MPSRRGMLTSVGPRDGGGGGGTRGERGAPRSRRHRASRARASSSSRRCPTPGDGTPPSSPRAEAGAPVPVWCLFVGGANVSSITSISPKSRMASSHRTQLETRIEPRQPLLNPAVITRQWQMEWDLSERKCRIAKKRRELRARGSLRAARRCHAVPLRGRPPGRAS